MFNKTMTAIGLSLAIATPVMALEGPFPIKDVDADTTLQAMDNTNALEFYPNIATDIENAIRARVDMADDEDYRPLNIDVLVTGLRLNDSPMLTADGEFNVLEGMVEVIDSRNPEVRFAQPVLLEAFAAEVPYPAFSPDDKDFYTAMVYAFADRAAEFAATVDELPDEGEVRN
jgi:hypothetical protein